MRGLDLGGLLITNITNVQWLSGFTGSAGLVVVTAESATFATDSRYTEQAAAQCPGFEHLRLQGADGEVAQIVEGAGVPRVGFESAHTTVAAHEKLRSALSDAIALVATDRLVETLRMVKSADEVERIEAACRLADRTYEHIVPCVRPGVSERDVMLELEWFMRREGHADVGFDTIVASGPRSALPHGRASERVMRIGDLITLDFGACLDYYCSDITRTVILGAPDEEQQRVHTTVVSAMNRAIEGLRPGLTGREADAIARDHITEAGYGERFGHGLGHSLGMLVHDGPGLSQRSDVTLEAGMVMTVEPGIYVPGWGGVRVEQDVLITTDGARVLTHAPTDLLAL
jgi:Xaa-Pro aminopeptidase